MEIAVVVQILILLVAVASVWTARKIARQRAALDFLRQYNKESGVSRGHKVIRKYDGESLAEYLKEGGENREDFLFLMNMFEILAVGLDSGIYDEKMIKDALGEELRDIYGKAEPLIRHVRVKYGGKAFKHIESLASKIKNQT